MTRARQIAWLPILLTASVCFAQQQNGNGATTPAPTKVSNTYVGKAIGKATVNNSPSLTTTNLYVDQNVVSDTVNHLHVISRGNTLIFTPNSQFHTRLNAFDLNNGGSKVASYTGMTAYLPHCFSVTPVDPNLLTLFEVDWSGQEVYVYARSFDVKINYWINGFPRSNEPSRPADNNWIVKQGHFARIWDVPACKPILYFGPEPTMPQDILTAAEIMAGPATAVTIWQLYETSPPKPNISQASP